jgi:hypothetical protein
MHRKRHTESAAADRSVKIKTKSWFDCAHHDATPDFSDVSIDFSYNPFPPNSRLKILLNNLKREEPLVLKLH